MGVNKLLEKIIKSNLASEEKIEIMEDIAKLHLLVHGIDEEMLKAVEKIVNEKIKGG